MIKVFSDASAEEFLRQEHQEHGLDFDDFERWIADPPNCSTFRVNTLKFTTEEATKIIEESLQKTAESFGFSSCPAVKVCSEMPDVLIIESWQTVPEYEANYSKDCHQEEDFVIVDCFCGAAILRGSHLFAPGVLALKRGVFSGQKVSVFADLDGKCLKGTATNYNGEKKLVGRGVLEMDREQLFNNLKEPPKGIAVRINWTPKGVLSMPFPADLGQLQNLPSSVASWELDPQPGDLVLDMCASPGNKTSHLAAIMQNQGTLIAIDRNEKKCELVRQTCSNFGAKCLVFAFDSIKACKEEDSKSILKGPPFLPASFDRILLDAPCSALGQRPQLLNKSTAKQIRSCPVLQKRLFETAVKLLKPGGTLVYCTCSTTCIENESLVQWALQEFGDKLRLQFPSKRFTPVTPLKNISEEITSKVQRFGPPSFESQENCDSIGFFIAKFKKIL